jgi:hypothetical protein
VKVKVKLNTVFSLVNSAVQNELNATLINQKNKRNNDQRKLYDASNHLLDDATHYINIQFRIEKVVLVFSVAIKSCHQNPVVVFRIRICKVIKNQNLQTHSDLKLGPEL